MSTEQLITALHSQLTAIRHDLHAHPELAYAETRSADMIAEYLGRLGLEVHRGLAQTGVVGRLRVGSGPRSIGLRADMDALPLTELNDFVHRSTHEGRMHACGHDGHMVMLLGAADVLASTRRFAGTVHFIFQPAEEMAGGGRAMVEEGLFERFPMDSVFALHNWPGQDVGHLVVRLGPMMAGADLFEIRLRGRGAHAAMPHQGRDVLVAGAALIQGLQSLVARNVSPQDAAVVSVTRFHAGQGDNVLPDEAVLGGTVRMFKQDVHDLIEAGMTRVCRGIEVAYGVGVELAYTVAYPPTINADGATALVERVARTCFGDANVHTDLDPAMGADDFAFLAQRAPGCYAWLGNGPADNGRVLHGPRYDFNDAGIPFGIRYWVELAQAALPRESPA